MIKCDKQICYHSSICSNSFSVDINTFKFDKNLYYYIFSKSVHAIFIFEIANKLNEITGACLSIYKTGQEIMTKPEA